MRRSNPNSSNTNNQVSPQQADNSLYGLSLLRRSMPGIYNIQLIRDKEEELIEISRSNSPRNSSS